MHMHPDIRIDLAAGVAADRRREADRARQAHAVRLVPERRRRLRPASGLVPRFARRASHA